MKKHLNTNKGVFPLPYKFPFTIKKRKTAYDLGYAYDFSINNKNWFCYYEKDGDLYGPNTPTLNRILENEPHNLELIKETIYNYYKTYPEKFYKINT